MARKKSARTIKSEQVRQRIMDVGYRMIQENGIENVGVRELSEAAGVTTGTFYYYFKDKEEMLFAHSMDRGGQFRERAETLAADTAYGKIVEYMSTCVADVIEEDGPEVILWILMRRQTHGILSDIIQGLVEEGIRSGEFINEKTASELTEFILDSYRGAAFAWYRNSGEDDIHKLVAEHVGYSLEHFLTKKA